MLRVLNICASFVFISALVQAASAAPAPIVPDLDAKAPPQTKPTVEEEERARLVHLTEPEVLSIESDEAPYFYRYRRAITLQTGAEISLKDTTNPGPLLGIALWYPARDLRGFEAGADLTRDATGTLYLLRREVTSNEKLRFHYQYGAGLRIIAKDQLVTFLRLRNWLVRGGGGLEWTIADPVSLRTDLEAMATSEDFRVALTAGLAFAW